jgi:dienelactone hydrolase
MRNTIDSPVLTRRDLLASTAAALLAGPTLRAAQDDGPSVDRNIQRLAERAPLALQFTGSTDDECRRWQQQFSAKLRELLGPHTPPNDWHTTVEGVVDRDDHTRHELLLSAPGQPTLPVYLLLPKGQGGAPRAGVVALHGHGNFGYDPVVGKTETPGVAEAIQNAHYDYGLQLVRRGYVVAAPCLQPFGRRLGDRDAYGRQDPCAVTMVRLALLGKVLMAENLRDVLWALELLARHDAVDANRLACVGLSYGGRMTMLAAALEPRIKAAVVSGALNVMQERITLRYSCGAQVIPGLLNYGDTPEIGSLIAPRPAVWEVGSDDSLVIPDRAADFLARMRRAYRAYDADDRLQVDRFEGGHRWNGGLAYPMLAQALS